MDANGLRFWMLANDPDWVRPGNPPTAQYEVERRSLRLARQRSLPVWSNRWSLKAYRPDQVESLPFSFTVQPSDPQPLQITALTPATPIASLSPQTLTFQGPALPPTAQVRLTFPDGRTTVVPAAPVPPDAERRSLSVRLSVPGAWSVAVLGSDGESGPPLNFTVQPPEVQPIQIIRIEPAIPQVSDTPQTVTVTGRGFQPEMRLQLTSPDGNWVELPATDITNLSETEFQFSFTFTGLESEQAARDRLSQVPHTRDRFGTRAVWNADTRQVEALGAAPEPVPIYRLPEGDTLTDMAMGYDGVLYLAVSGQIILQDRRERWSPQGVTAEGFEARVLAAAPEGGVWVLGQVTDGSAWAIARLQGQPLPDRPHAAYAPGTFRPCQENPHLPQLISLWSGTLDAETPVAIAVSPQGQLALLTWVNGGNAHLRLFQPEQTWSEPLSLTGARFPYSLTWVAPNRVAVLLTGLRSEAPTYPVPSSIDRAQQAYPLGDLYPLRDHTGDRFVQGVTQPPHYPTVNGSQPLYPLSLPTFAARGVAYGLYPFDSGSAQTIWHRLYLEAVIPPACGLRIYLAATDSLEVDPDTGQPQPPAFPSEEWFEHQFGQAPPSRDVPQGVWVSMPSELPYHPGVLPCPIKPNQAGLFTVLVQRAHRRVRSLQGRYLWVWLELQGDEQSTPEVAALRVYASRFSYRDRYLPTLYQESLFGPDADQPGSSTPADFLERFLSNFESFLTPLEDRIAQADLLTDPRTVPEAALNWLGHWIGVTTEAGYPPEHQRQFLLHAPTLYRQRGTLSGLQTALQIALPDCDVVVLEDFRLRRTFATILGANLADETDPLLQGLSVSGNSYVGDTLILGDETRREFLALFGPDLPNADEAAAIAAFFDELAYRVTILVHDAATPQHLGLIRRLVDLETPAHLITRVLKASHPFIVSAASLVGVDTYLAAKPQPQSVRVGESQVGVRDLILRPPSLDPRLGGVYVELE